MLFFPIQQELDCISYSGEIVGKIRFDDVQGKHIFYQPDGECEVSAVDMDYIQARLDGLDTGVFEIPMQDDD